jgi:hypothetical protein
MSTESHGTTAPNGSGSQRNGEALPSGDQPWERYSKEDLWYAYRDAIVGSGEEDGELIARNQELANEVQTLRFRLAKYGDDTSDLEQILEEPKSTVSHPLRDTNPLDGCKPIPDEAFEDLPRVLDETCKFWPQPHKRDLYLSASLGYLSGVMPKVEGYWGANVPSAVEPNLYVAGVLGAAGGKGVVSHAKSLVNGVAESIQSDSVEERQKWKRKRKDAENEDVPFDDPEPIPRTLLVPANISQAQLMHQLAGQSGRGIISSSEIDTLNDTLGQDWGKVDTFLRKAYHHETDAQARRGDGLIQVEDPAISLVLTGTLDQFVKLIPSSENGLYSRFCLYHAASVDPYQSQRPSALGIRQMERFQALSGRIEDLWTILNGRRESLRFQLTDRQWKRLDETFQPLHREVQELGFYQLISIPRRAGLWAFKIAMTLAVLRAHDNGVNLRSADVIEVNDADFQAALLFTSTFADHSLRFARSELGDSSPPEPRDRRIAAMLTGVGNTFASGEAYSAAHAAGIDASEKTLRRDLKLAAQRGLIGPGSTNGSWEKTG